MSIVLTRHDML